MALNFDQFKNEIQTFLFDENLNPKQEEGLEFLTLLLVEDYDWPLEWVAYGLATVYHETGRSMEPISEHGNDSYFYRMYDMHGERPEVAEALGNVKAGDGVKFHGRGYVQLTGRGNYSKMTELLNAEDVDLVEEPDLALDSEISAHILAIGMEQGVFTNHALSDYFNHEVEDPVGARRIVNGSDKAEEISNYYHKFLQALQHSWKEEKDPIEKKLHNYGKRIERLEQIFIELRNHLNGL